MAAGPDAFPAGAAGRLDPLRDGPLHAVLLGLLARAAVPSEIPVAEQEHDRRGLRAERPRRAGAGLSFRDAGTDRPRRPQAAADAGAMVDVLAVRPRRGVRRRMPGGWRARGQAGPREVLQSRLAPVVSKSIASRGPRWAGTPRSSRSWRSSRRCSSCSGRRAAACARRPAGCSSVSPTRTSSSPDGCSFRREARTCWPVARRTSRRSASSAPRASSRSRTARTIHVRRDG